MDGDCDRRVSRPRGAARRFRQDHPGVTIGAGNGWWQARIPEPNGEIVTTRYTLCALLDKLDELLGENRGGTP